MLNDLVPSFDTSEFVFQGSLTMFFFVLDAQATSVGSLHVPQVVRLDLAGLECQPQAACGSTGVGPTGLRN